MRKSLTVPAAALALALWAAGAAHAGVVYDFTTFDAPGATQGTFAFGLNDAGEIVGYFRDANNVNHGFLRDTAGGFTVLDYPGAGSTDAAGISSSGVIVGSYSAFNGAPNHGFVLSGGTYTPLDDPLATYVTDVNGISASGRYIVGSYDGGAGFLLSGGTYTTLDIPAVGNVFANGINDSGQVVGNYGGGGFLLDGSILTPLNFPGVGAAGTYGTGINDSGEVVGYYGGTGGQPSSLGFLYDGGSYQTFNVPGATRFGTVLFGINDRDQITGYYFDNNDVAHGFLATPTPEPSSLALAAVGAVALAAWRWRRRGQAGRPAGRPGPGLPGQFWYAVAPPLPASPP